MEKATLKAEALAEPAPSSKRFEDVKARTKFSSTTVDPSTGTRITEISPVARNFKDASGKWTPIDASLEEVAGEGWQNTAAPFAATLPRAADEPVVLQDGSNPNSWVSVDLVGGTGARGDDAESALTPADGVTGVLAKTTATYDDVLPGVDIALQSQASGVKETLTLASPHAAASWTYELRTGTGMTAEEANGVVSVRGTDGKLAFVLPAPFMDDAAGAHSTDIDVEFTKAAAGNWNLTITPSAEWLGAKDRAWPVVVDPTIEYPSSILGCAISSASPTATSCSGGEIPLSWDSSSGAQRRGLLRFPTLFDVVPADAQIAKADLKVKVAQVAGAASTTVDVKELSSSFASGATWNTRNGSTAWGTAGGDRGGAFARTTIAPAAGGYFTFNVAAAVQRWLEGTSTYNGFELEKTSAVSGGAPVRLTQINDTSLYLEWSPRAGNRKGNSAIVSEELSDATSVSVNPATGNATVTTRQLEIAGLGLDLNVSHSSNSLSSALLGVNGARWVDSLSGPGLQPYGDTLFWRDASGAEWTFYKALDGSWTRPLGLDVDLVQSGSIITVTERDSAVVQTFIDIGTSGSAYYGLSKVVDRNGHQITFNYDSSARLPYNGHLILRSVTDTRGRQLGITNYGYWNSWVTDVANRSPSTTVTNNELASETNAGGGVTSYEYDSSDRVTAVIVPGGQRTELTYDSTGRVLTLKRVSSTQANPTWSFSYGTFDRSGGAPATQTQVTDPNGNVTTYKSDGRGRVASAVDARGKARSSTFTANDDGLTATGATLGSGSGGQTTTNSYDTAGGNELFSR